MIDLYEKNTALVLIDIQMEYFQQGHNPLVNPEYALTNAKKVLEIFRNNKQLVIHVKHEKIDKNATYFLPNSESGKIHKDVYPTESEYIIIKHKPDSFRGTTLHQLLQSNNIERIVVCGMMSHHCVESTVRQGSNDYDVVVIHDACATKDLSFIDEVITADMVHKTSMAALKGFSTVISTKEILSKCKTQ